MEVGLIGLGKMGTGIAKSLLRAGHQVTVYNRTRERAEALRKDGAGIAGSVAEACSGDAVLTMLADDAALEAVVFGEQRLTYERLNERANRLANYLRKLGVGPEVLVGVCVGVLVGVRVGVLVGVGVGVGKA